MRIQPYALTILSALIFANPVSAQETLAGLLADPAVQLSRPADRARVVARMAEIENTRRQNARARATLMSLPLRTESANGRVQEIADFDGDQPVYHTTHNVNAAISTGANLLRTSPYTLNGSGVTIGLWDGGSARATHQEFGGRVIVMDGAGSSDHATHVGGTLIALGVNASARGMANAATVNSYDWNSDTSEMASRGATYAGEPGAIYLSNHSYSYITGWNYTGNPSRLWEWWGNGTNAAKNTTAILQTTGDYQISVSIADTGGLAVTSAVNVRVLQTEDSLVVTPASANVQFGTTRLFSASLLDQFGAPMGSQPASFEWTGGGGGTIDDPNYEGSASGSLVIEPGNDLVSWKNEHFTPAEQTAGLAANNADPDFDTLPNLAEYALGTDPRQITPSLILTLDANGLTLTFTRPANLPDVTYAAESSEELETWSPIPLEVITPGDPETVRARDPLTTGDPSKRFLRLRFEIP